MRNLGGLQVGGGISVENAQEWIDFGANKVGRSLSVYSEKAKPIVNFP